MDKTLMLMIADVVISGASYMLTRYLAPEAAEPALYLIGLLQPVVIYLIKAEKDKAVAAITAGLNPKTLMPWR